MSAAHRKYTMQPLPGDTHVAVLVDSGAMFWSGTRTDCSVACAFEKADTRVMSVAEYCGQRSEAAA